MLSEPQITLMIMMAQMLATIMVICAMSEPQITLIIMMAQMLTIIMVICVIMIICGSDNKIRLPGLDALEMDISPEATAQVRQVLASYLGHFKHANAFHLIQAIFKRHDWLNHLFEFQNGRLTDRLRHKGVFRSFPTQATWYKTRFPECILLFQVGLYIEAYEEDALFLHQHLNLKLKPNSRKMRHTVGFPRRLEKHFTSAILKKTGRSVVHVKETGPGKYVKERWPERLICQNRR